MNDMNPRATIGGNTPPPYDQAVLETATAQALMIADTAGAWMDLGQIESAEESQMLTDFVSGARAVEKDIEAARVAAKKPHDDAAKAVQGAFKRPLDIVSKVIAKAKALQGDWMQRERQRAESERRAQAEEAARLADEARVEAARAAMANDVVGETEAEEKAAAAEKAAKAAAKPVSVKADSYTGGGRAMSLRTIRTAEINNARAVCNHFIEDPALLDVIQRLATAAIRRGEVVPGTTVKETQVAA